MLCSCCWPPGRRTTAAEHGADTVTGDTEPGRPTLERDQCPASELLWPLMFFILPALCPDCASVIYCSFVFLWNSFMGFQRLIERALPSRKGNLPKYRLKKKYLH